METYEKIKAMREIHQWTQEDTAEKLGMSPAGYAKIERGQSNINIEKLKQIASIFNINAAQLLDDNDKFLICSIGDNHSNYSNYFGNNEILAIENERQRIELEYKDKLLAQKENELNALRKIIELLEKDKNALNIKER